MNLNKPVSKGATEITEDGGEGTEGLHLFIGVSFVSAVVHKRLMVSGWGRSEFSVSALCALFATCSDPSAPASIPV
jgi:hypothetical protein